MNNLRYLLVVGVAVWTSVLMGNFTFAQISFRTDLAGESEVPPLFSESYGSALVVGNDSGLKYQINVTSLDKVTGAFLYKGDSTENGQVLVSFLNSTEPSGVIDGNLVEGMINSSSILAPLSNLTTNVTSFMPASSNLTNATSAVPTGNLTNATSAVAPPSKLEALIDLMNQNMTYINIHTSDFPEGELRGTLTSTNSTG
ncbi:MAG TPA: CHRD domain-containing protein [Nitrososphaeraceae archaeon]|nr:CHRD domain-containing protein [Nitrososphaeraceae archaeon]